jgi:Fe-S-cluster containining protein
MGIRVRIGSQRPLACGKRPLIGEDDSDETGETETLCHGRCGTIKIAPSLLKGPERRT